MGKGGVRTFVSERELCHLTHTEALAVAGEEILCIRFLETEGAARQAELADEAVLLDHTNGKLRLTSGKAALLLNAEAGAAALGKDEDFVEVEGRVAANASGIHHLGHLGVSGTVLLFTVSLRNAWDGRRKCLGYCESTHSMGRSPASAVFGEMRGMWRGWAGGARLCAQIGHVTTGSAWLS